jgi:hypothetical protein
MEETTCEAKLRWENIKMELKEMRFETVHWIYLAQDRIH